MIRSLAFNLYFYTLTVLAALLGIVLVPIPTPVLLRQKAGIPKGSTTPGKTSAGTVTEADIEEVAKIKMPDLNAYDLEAAKQQVRGTARSMGLKVG